MIPVIPLEQAKGPVRPAVCAFHGAHRPSPLSRTSAKPLRRAPRQQRPSPGPRLRSRRRPPSRRRARGNRRAGAWGRGVPQHGRRLSACPPGGRHRGERRLAQQRNALRGRTARHSRGCGLGLPAGARRQDGSLVRFRDHRGSRRTNTPTRPESTSPLIVQGTTRFYGTLGDSRCTVDSLTQRRLGQRRPGQGGTYRVEARGFCTQPAHAVRGEGAVLVSTFEFAGPVTYDAQD